MIPSSIFLSDFYLDRFSFILWALWNHRNARMNGHPRKFPTQFLDGVARFLVEFREVHANVSVPSPSGAVSSWNPAD